MDREHGATPHPAYLLPGVVVGPRRWSMRRSIRFPRVARHEAAGAGQQDGGTAGLGEAVLPASTEDSSEPFVREGMAEDPLPEPLPGQARPDANGRCPRKQQVVRNGGCWRLLKLDREECEEVSGHLFKDACYVPGTSPPRRKPTSSPAREP